MSARISALDALVFGVDVQSGDVRGDAPSYALVVLDEGSSDAVDAASNDGTAVERDVVSSRKLRRLIEDREPDLVATDNMYELAEDKDHLVHFLASLPDGTRLVQVTGDEQPEPLSRVAKRHGVPYGKDPMQEAEAAARLAAHNVGHEVSAFFDRTEVKVARGRSTGKGGWSEDRYTRRIHGSVRRRAREIESTLSDAGLEYEMDPTEKYGGYSNAIFTVEARPEDIPVTTGRSGDVRVEIERQRRDGIEFEPLAKRRDYVIVGIDPGTTTAVAIVDLDGGVHDVLSTRTADMAAVIEWIIERGQPLLVAADVTPMPETVEKIRRSFDAAAWAPDEDLPVDEKQHRTRDEGYDNDHERDALAAALFAHDDHVDQFERIAAKLPPGMDRGEVTARVVAGEESVEAAVESLSEDDSDPEETVEHTPRELTEEEQRIKDLERQVERLQGHVEDLRETVAEKDDRIDDLEGELSAERSRERQEARERREVTRLKRERDRLERKLAEERERNDAVEKKVERLKELWKLDHSNFADVEERKKDLVPIKPIEKFTKDAIHEADEAYGIAKGDVVYLRDASGAGRSTAELLVTYRPRVVLKEGGLSDIADRILFEAEVPVGPADDVAMQEVDELAVARETDVAAVIEDWRERARQRRQQRKAEMVDSLINEHRAERDLDDLVPSREHSGKS
ncbi:MAG: putative RNase H-like nuclease (RuvC/YqgF family) [Halobacteriales archaeon]